LLLCSWCALVGLAGAGALGQSVSAPLPARIEFDVALSVPKLDRLQTTLFLDGADFVNVEAKLQFDRKGRIICGGLCTVDGVPVAVKGKIVRKGNAWAYSVVMRNAVEPKVHVAVSGIHGEGTARCSYSGPRGSVSSRQNPIVVTAPSGELTAAITLFPTVGPSGKIKGTGRFSEGYGNDGELDGKLSGALVGDYLTWTLKGGKKRIQFSGSRLVPGTNGQPSYTGELYVRMPPEKRIHPLFTFPHEDSAATAPRQSNRFSKQRPYVLRFQFPLLDKLSSRLIKPGDAGVRPPRDEDFRIYEDDVLIDSFETNQFIVGGDIKQHQAVLILDYTGSICAKGAICEMVEAAIRFIDDMRDNTSLALVAFWERQNGFARIRDFTPCDADGKALLTCDLVRFAPGEHGASQLWDAIGFALDLFQRNHEPVSRSIVFITDGHDTSSAGTVDDLVQRLQSDSRDVSLYPLGFGVRSDLYPQDRGSLERLASVSGGGFFVDEGSREAAAHAGGCACSFATPLPASCPPPDAKEAPAELRAWAAALVDEIRQRPGNTGVGKLFEEVGEKLTGEWVLSYVTLKESGSHQVRIESAYDAATFEFPSVVFSVDDELKGDIRRGLLSLIPPGNPSQRYILFARYVPRGIHRFRFQLLAGAAGVRPRFLEGTGLLSSARGWTLEGPDDEGWVTLAAAGAQELKYGCFGTLLEIDAVGPAPSLTVRVDDSIYADKSFAFDEEGYPSESTKARRY
jgi:hypothetical protein